MKDNHAIPRETDLRIGRDTPFCICVGLSEVVELDGDKFRIILLLEVCRPSVMLSQFLHSGPILIAQTLIPKHGRLMMHAT